MRDTADIQQKLIQVIEGFEHGSISAGEARVIIGAARGILDAKKVEIAAAHLGGVPIPAVPVGSAQPLKVVGGKKKAA